MKILITENQKESLKNNLMDIINKFGFTTAAKAVGTRENLIKILFDGEIKKYLDNVFNYIVNKTKIDYDEGKIDFPFISSYTFSTNKPPSGLVLYSKFKFSEYGTASGFGNAFLDYCKDKLGLTNDEIDDLWEKYTKIILDKIENN